VKLLSDVRALLTPEQQAKLDAYIAAAKQRRNGSGSQESRVEDSETPGN
jgi:Spy/CpxP family protein refolding chaperone